MKGKNSFGQVYPNFVCRLGGEEVNKFQDLSSGFLAETTGKLKKLIAEVEKLKTEISDELFLLVSKVENKSQRNKVLKIRRDIFNKKNLSEEKLQFITELIEKKAVDKIEHFYSVNSEITLLNQTLKEGFKEEYKASRLKFIDMLDNTSFQKGLLISSKPLYESQKYYFSSEDNLSDRKIEQIERGLLRYYSRMAMKATPFSTFCSIIPGYITDSEDCSGMHLEGNPDDQRSLLLLNKGLYGNLTNLLVKRKNIKQEINLELNPTFRFENEKLTFLTSVDSKEVFQRMQNNPVLDLIKELIGEGKTIKFKDLIRTLIEKDVVDAEEEEIVEYIDKLIEIGFLHFRFEIPDQDLNWPVMLRDFLKNIDDEHAQLCYALMDKLLLLLDDYSEAEVEDRHKIIVKMDDSIKDTFEKMEVEIEFKSELPLYEDSTADLKVSINSNEFQKISEKLIRFIKVSNRLSWPRTEKHTMRHFYDDFYGKETGAVPLLKFYEDYYREHYKEHSELVELSKNRNPNVDKEKLKNYNVSNPFNLKINQDITNAHQKVTELIRNKWEKDLTVDQVNFTFEELEEAVSGIPEIEGEPNSVSLFSQIVLTDNKIDKLIVPAGTYLNGYGKYFSRFIRLFSKEEQEKIREVNSQYTDKIIAEISGDANFNANLHPPMLEWEISYPLGESGLSDKTLYTTDISVVRCPDNDASISLYHNPTGKFLSPVDLGFLNPMMRPPLYQLMSKFTTPANFSFRVPESPKKYVPQKNKEEQKSEDKKETKPEENKKQEPEVVYIPRISFDDDIIISRKKWKIPAALFVTPGTGENNEDYLIRLTEWRAVYNIPDEVYVRIQPLPTATKPEDKKETSKEENQEKTEAAAEKKEEAEVKSEEVKEEKSSDEKEDTNKEQTTDKEAQKKMMKRQKFSRDFQKPQYIDFNNPLLVNLFKKMTVNLKNFIVTVEERYPERNQLPKVGERDYTSETIFQISIPVDKKEEVKVLEKEELYEC